MLIRKFIIYIILALLVAGCASQVAPTGGDKDVMAPEVIRSNPENLTIHFDANKINLAFNEYIQQGDFASEIFFSPTPEQKPEYRIHGKTLSITLNGDLKPQTTYTVNFGSAIKDITEGNVMLSYQYVFSTGDYIDSLRLDGIVKGASDGLPQENILVMLYTDLTDSIIVKDRPAYYTRSREDGTFRISHLKKGEYKLVALNDLDANLMYSQVGEGIAFADSSIKVEDTSGFYSLQLFKSFAPNQKVINTSSMQPGKVTIAFARPFKNLHITFPSDSDKRAVVEYNAGSDTAYLWINDLISDSIFLAIKDKDFSDTLGVRMKKVNEKEKISAPKFGLAAAPKKGRSSLSKEPDKPLEFEFSTPVISINEQKSLFLLSDSATQPSFVKAALISDSITKKSKVSVSFPFQEKMGYKLVIPDSSFIDVYGRYNDSTSLKFITFENAETGNLSLNIIADSVNHYFYEFRSSIGELIYKSTLTAGLNALSFSSLRPGNYSLRVIDDQNGNSQWDTGDYWRHLQPEKIYSYADEITLRANWDLEVEMKIGLTKKSVSKEN
ncbi:MAG: Ig-like domain-containing protein [Chitinophagales bacterium]|nr:Ig-like domain-containing protein [Chitinophagales bacterium]